MADSTRRQREIEHIRTDILHAAARALAREGLERATIHDIACEAGYSTTSLYAYFKGKQEIVDALVGTMADEFEIALDEQPPAGLGFSQRLEILVTRWSELGERWREALSVLFTFQDATGQGVNQLGARLGSGSFLDRLAVWLEKAATGGELGAHDPAAVACMLMGILRGAQLSWQRRGYGEDPRQFFSLALRVFLLGVSGAGATAAIEREKTR